MTIQPCLVLAVLIAIGAQDKPLLRLNEVLYDPPGPDTGFEFVELHHSGTVPLPLAGFELWFLNGATPDAAPRVVWRAGAASEIAPGGYFVVGEDGVPERDDTARLGLQNGPDALWLVFDGERVDAVAWGDEAAALGEGGAAPLARSASIGRVPDGADTDDNAQDFRILPESTPGRENLRAVAIEPLRMEIDPVWRADPGWVTGRIWWRADGWSPRQRDLVRWMNDEVELELAEGDTAFFERQIELSLGGQLLEAAGSTRRLDLAVWTGTAAVILTEVQARPASEEPEWIEVLAADAEAVTIADWSIADAHSGPRRIGNDTMLAAGQRLVLCADVAAWRNFYPGSGASVVRPEGGWPTLNDSDGADGYADAVVLYDASGVVVDRMSYRAKDIVVRGRSLQRTAAVRDGAAVWIGSLGGPTPGRGHPAESQGASPLELQIRPDPFTPDDDGVDDVLEVIAPSAPGRARAEVRDLSGVLVRELEGVIADDRSYWQWDGTDARGRRVAAGAYIVVVRGETDAGEVTVWRAVVGLDRAP